MTENENIRSGVSRFLAQNVDIHETAMNMNDETMRDCGLIAKYIADQMDAYTWLHCRIGRREWCDIATDCVFDGRNN